MSVNNPKIDKSEHQEKGFSFNSEKREFSDSTHESFQEDENTQTKPIALLSNLQMKEKFPPKMFDCDVAFESLFKDATSYVSFTDPEPEKSKDQTTQVKIRLKVKPMPSHDELACIKQNEDSKNIMPVLQTPLSILSKHPPELILFKDFGASITPEQLQKFIQCINKNKNCKKMNKAENKTKFKDSQVDILLKSFISEDFSQISRRPMSEDSSKEKSPETISSQTLIANSFIDVLRKNILVKLDKNVDVHKELPQDHPKPLRDSIAKSLKDNSTSMTFTPEKKPSQELLKDLACEGEVIEHRRKVFVTVPDGGPSLDWNDYYRLENIHAHMEKLEYLYPSLCTTFDIGQSVEGRKLKIIKISNSNATNASVWMDAGIHGREWIAPAVAVYVIHQLSTNFHTMENFMTNKDWYILPVMNPDGYEYSHTMNRLWRKNRAQVNRKTTGVDLNRNFSVGWGKKGSSNDPDSQNYHGPGPFSEPESSAVRDMLLRSGVKFHVYLTLHCFAQVILFPYSHTAEPSPDYNRLLEGATIMSRAIFNTSGQVYKVGTSKELLKGAAGTSADWSYEVAKIPYCYTIELRERKVASANRTPTQVWEVSLVREGQRYFLKFLDIEGAINIWKEQTSKMDIMVEGSRAATVAGMLHEREIPYTIAIRDVDVLIARESLYGPGMKVVGQKRMDWQSYHRLSEIYEFLDNLEQQYPYLCTVIVIGKTNENRDIKVLKISNKNQNNVGVWIDGGIHAREWITPAAACYLADQIVRRYNSHPESITNKDWYILPVMNPDGYEYTFDHDRMWRKNRSRFGELVGVDLNRNFSFGWGKNGEEGSSADPGSVFHRGPRPFSEPETMAVKKTILESSTKFKVFISLHSYGEVIIFPWGYTGDPCPDYVELLQGGSVMARAIKEDSNHIYRVGSTKDLLYYASGSSIDWSYGDAKIPYSFIMELRDKSYKFLLPKEEIAGTCKEVMSGVFGLLDFIDNKCGTHFSCTSCIESVS